MKPLEGNLKRLLGLAAIVSLLCAPLAQPGLAKQKAKQDLRSPQARLADEVRHELVMLPYYDVFDNLEYRIDGTDTVVLSGQVTRPTLKSGAERVVQRVEGVGNVINNIEVLPVSQHDDRIRLATYRAIFARAGLDRYVIRAVPPIHIIVKNGNVTLEGVVANEMDKNMAGMAANGVSGVFSVTNNLKVEEKKTS